MVAVCALAGVLMELVAALRGAPTTAPHQFEQIVRLFSFFTIQSNLLVGGVSFALALRPERDAPGFRVIRLDALLCISVTGLVYNTVLRGLGALTAAGLLSNFLLHVAAPVLAVLAWLLCGPRPRVSWSTVGWSILYPVLWLVYTFIRGAVTGWFPYQFLDAGEIGWGGALGGAGTVALVFVGLAAVARWADLRLPATGRQRAVGGP